MKNIQRRKAPQGQQIGSHAGSSTELEKVGLKGELERLKKEKSLMIQEVSELQQQHHGTVQHMETMNEKLLVAEQRQKQMVSFLAKLLQNPVFLARLQQKKEQRTIASPKTKRKFVKHQQHEPHKLQSSEESQIVKYRTELGNLTTTPDLSPTGAKEISDLNMTRGTESVPLQIEKVTAEELPVANELLKTHEQAVEGVSSLGRVDPLSRGKNVLSPETEVSSEYLVSFPEDLAKEKNFPEFLSPGIENIVKQEDIWSIGFETGTSTPGYSNELWGNLSNYDVPELGVSSSLSDIWDLGPLQAGGSSGVEKWPGDESPFHELDNQASQPRDDSSEKMDP